MIGFCGCGKGCIGLENCKCVNDFGCGCKKWVCVNKGLKVVVIYCFILFFVYCFYDVF